ncbi:hypothetical protein ElyMa_005343500 [Elysia marginata]|uniref:HEAT repeat-containing protein 1 n=1 Tax=Elysia marginata TaxID=1093978 RepID=A0AAV4E9Y1_9GAST|nr:hypothetical protein ElyMa_005343500 [Elysia marginata]
MFKSFILKFEQKTPQIHKLHDEIVETAKRFFATFVKVEHIKLKKLVEKDLSLPENSDLLLPLSQVYTGKKTEELLHTLSAEDKKKVLIKLQNAYIKTGQYFIKKLPIHKFLEALSALDPVVRGHSVAVAAMTGLKNFWPKFHQGPSTCVQWLRFTYIRWIVKNNCTGGRSETRD